MAKCEAELTTTITLKMNYEEANWLRGYLQNWAFDNCSEDEHNYNNRVSLFDAINSAMREKSTLDNDDM